VLAPSHFVVIASSSPTTAARFLIITSTTATATAASTTGIRLLHNRVPHLIQCPSLHLPSEFQNFVQKAKWKAATSAKQNHKIGDRKVMK
jgi:hypothetical protein